jgi:hypothetical protein
MSITNGYATLAEFKLWGSITSTDANDDSVIEDCIEAASRYIDGETLRTFYARTETRYYDVPEAQGRPLLSGRLILGSRLLKLDDDLLTITTLTNGDGNTIDATEYNLIPKNLTQKRAIKLKASSSKYWDMDSDGNTEWVISVAGTWGYSSTAPHDIRQACLMIGHSIYKRRMGENTSSSVKVTGAGVVITPQDVPSQAAAIIQKYRKRI